MKGMDHKAESIYKPTYKSQGFIFELDCQNILDIADRSLSVCNFQPCMRLKKILKFDRGTLDIGTDRRTKFSKGVGHRTSIRKGRLNFEGGHRTFQKCNICKDILAACSFYN